MKWLITWALMLVVWVVVLTAWLIGHARAHDSNTAKTTTEAAVFDFYATWMIPPDRSRSCCNMTDCHVVEIRREGERYFFLDNIYQHAWRLIPPKLLEQNTQDPRESPDGQSHACFVQDIVFCAVLGSGQ